MSLPAISSVAITSNQPELQRSTPTPVASHQAQASLPTDNVSLSPAAQKATSGTAVDHGGDSH
jgi:hypothetical protein